MELIKINVMPFNFCCCCWFYNTKLFILVAHFVQNITENPEIYHVIYLKLYNLNYYSPNLSDFPSICYLLIFRIRN